MNTNHQRRSVTLSSMPPDSNSHEAVPRARYDFANILRTVVCTEQLAEESPRLSSRHLEQNFKPDSIKRRDSQIGEQSSGLFAKHRRGDCIPSKSLRDEIGSSYPNVRRIEKSLLWDYLRDGKFPEGPVSIHMKTLGDEAFWTIHKSGSVQRSRHCAVRRTIDNDLLCKLAAQGSMDAVLAILLLMQEVKEWSKTYIFAVLFAQYVPATIVLLSLRRPFASVAPLILARLRQIEFENLEESGRHLFLADYNVNGLAINVGSWEPTTRPSGLTNEGYIRHLIDIGENAVDAQSKALIESLLPDYCSVQRTKTTPKWRRSIPPLAVSGQGRTEQTTFTKKALRVFQSTLGKYWNSTKD